MTSRREREQFKGRELAASPSFLHYPSFTVLSSLLFPTYPAFFFFYLPPPSVFLLITFHSKQLKTDFNLIRINQVFKKVLHRDGYSTSVSQKAAFI